MNRQIAGTQLSRTAAHRDEQLFSPGEERAIADHCGVMAGLEFPVTNNILQKIAQNMLNSCNQPPKTKGSILVNQGPSLEDSKVHTIGVHWVNRFLAQNSEFRKWYIRYQEDAHKAASSDEESQIHFLLLLSKLIRRHKVSPEDIWNCNEIGIILGRNQVRRVAIVRAAMKQPTMMTEGSRKFCSGMYSLVAILLTIEIITRNRGLVLDTINAAGCVIPPFIVCGGKTHRESYYNKDDSRDTTFAVSESGYMDDDLGLLYISQHFEPHTRNADRAHILIVDGHSSHICWRVIQFAVEHSIYLIQLPSKSTHVLQPLDVGCFALLQAAYERHLPDWLLKNPLGVIRKVNFLDLLFSARTEVYTVNTVKSAWEASRCWPIDLDRVHRVPVPVPAPVPLQDLPTETPESEAESNIRALKLDTSLLDTPLRVRKLARETQNMLLDDSIDKGAKVVLFQSLVDIATAKIAEYRDIAPRATTLYKLRNGRTRTRRRGPSRQVGTARVLSRKVLNEELKRLELAEVAKTEREKAALERKVAIEERRNAKQAIETQWKFDLSVYTDQVNAWRKDVATLEAAWREERDKARTAHQRPAKKPTLPNRPRRPLKPKSDLSMVHEDLTVIQEEEYEAGDVAPSESAENEELAELMHDLNLDRFEQML